MKQKYYTVDEILKLAESQHIQYLMPLGEKSNGKSFAVKHYVVAEAIKDDRHKFIYLRRWQEDIKQSLVIQYFGDLNTDGWLMEHTENKANGVTVYQGGIYLAYTDSTGDTTRGKLIGYARALSQSEHYASGDYTDCSNMMFEEFISNASYLAREPEKLMIWVSTVARRNEIRVWLIGNTLSRVCPYFAEWDLRNVPKQKQGTIDVYDFKTDQIDDDGEPVTVKIAVQLCENSGKNSKMIFGKAAPMITGGHWKTEEHAHLPKPVRKYSEVWSVVIEAVNFKFLAQVLYDPEGGGLIWYVQPKTTPIQPGTRVITDKLDTDPMHTVGFYPLSPEESELFDIMLRQRKVFFSDNQTGTDFYECLKKQKI